MFKRLSIKETAEGIHQQSYGFSYQITSRKVKKLTNNPSFKASCFAVSIDSSLDICSDTGNKMITRNKQEQYMHGGKAKN